MIDLKKLEKLGLTRGKAILIVVLVVVFVAVMISNFIPASKPAVTTKPKKRRGPNLVVAKTIKSESSESVEFKPWPIITLADARNHDPFALPEPLVPAEPDPVETDGAEETKQNYEIVRRQQLQLRQQKLESLRALQQSGDLIALVTPKDRVLIIGDKRLHVGDTWEGVRIKEIRPDGTYVVDFE